MLIMHAIINFTYIINFIIFIHSFPLLFFLAERQTKANGRENQRARREAQGPGDAALWRYWCA